MEEERGSSVKYLSIPFYDHLKIIPLTPTLLSYSTSRLAALSEQVSSHTLHQTHLFTFLWNEGSLFSSIFVHLYYFGRGFWIVGYPLKMEISMYSPLGQKEKPH